MDNSYEIKIRLNIHFVFLSERNPEIFRQYVFVDNDDIDEIISYQTLTFTVDLFDENDITDDDFIMEFDHYFYLLF